MPDLIGFYANNDGMALGMVEAVKAVGKAEQIAVFGTNGISDAYAAIKAGDLTGTVDRFPVLTGEIALGVSLRLMAGQALPRVVATPQALIDHQGQCGHLFHIGHRGPARCPLEVIWPI